VIKHNLGKWSGMLLAALGFSVVLGGVALALWMLAANADRETRLREQQQVAHGIAGWIEETEARIVGQTNWDDALKNLGVQYNAEWARTNVGQFLHDMGGLEQAYVLDAADQPVYGMIEGQDVAPRSYAGMARAAAPLIVEIRRGEAQRPPMSGRPPFAVMLSKPIQASLVSRVGGQPAVISATLVQPDFGTVSLAGRAPIVITVEALNQKFLTKFGSRFLLSEIALRDLAAPVGDDEAAYELTSSDGAGVGRLSWRRQSPGMHLLGQAMPPVLALLALLLAGTIALSRRARRGAQALIASESRSTFMAFHDHLTGLPNRALFQDRLSTALRALQRGAEPIGVFLIDLDRFKQVNDCYGHGAGDELIKQVAGRIQGLLRASDTICRLGGDEFAILCASVSPKGLATLGDRIIATLAEPIDLDFGRMYVGASVGITVISSDLADSGEALRQADLAMYVAKDAGGSCYRFFESEMDLALKTRQGIEADLREALANGCLTMAYQPQVDARGNTFGVEALVRWDHPERGMVSPSTFVAIAEEGGLIDVLGAFTFRRAFADSLRWPDLKVAVNVSAIQLRSPTFVELIRQVLKETGADPKRIELEITEGVLLNDNQATHQTLRTLRDIGFSISLDDFGTGYSSLSYLRKYPVDKVKIDRSFITNLGNDREAEAVVGAIVKLARALSLDVIAEGVETEAQMGGLRRAGCGDVQGYLYSRPMPADDIDAFVLGEKAAAA
jgi:diguanylate cyclase (GGDEF)-like protein